MSTIQAMVHAARRQAVGSITENALNSSGLLPAHVSFTSIDPTALANATNFQHFGSNHWASTPDYCRQKYARLDLAIWSGTTLCGLALGRFSRAETVLKLDYVEGRPDPHPLKGRILEIVVQYGLVLAAAYKCKRFRATRPAPHVVTALQNLADPFTYVASDPDVPYVYCEKVLP